MPKKPSATKTKTARPTKHAEKDRQAPPSVSLKSMIKSLYARICETERSIDRMANEVRDGFRLMANVLRPAQSCLDNLNTMRADLKTTVVETNKNADRYDLLRQAINILYEDVTKKKGAKKDRRVDISKIGRRPKGPH